jgi:diadenylate cyclase
MVKEKDKTLFDFIKLVSPGMPLRTVINDLVRSGLGAMIIFDSPELNSQDISEGGFRINSRFTPQKLFELCKMDGAIILSSDLKRILTANTLINADASIHTNETGTRHKASERAAKQANTFIIAVSEKRNKTTLYYGSSKYFLKTSEELLRNISSTLQVLEKQREMFDEHLNNLNILEMSGLTSVDDVCKVIQRAEMILIISESVKRNFTELGKDGNIMQIRYRELLRGVEKLENGILRDYSSLSLKKSKNLLKNLAFDGFLETESTARLILEKPLEEPISPRGYRFLSLLNLSENEISNLIHNFKDIDEILSVDSSKLEDVIKNRAAPIKKDIINLREQVLSGKAVF